VVLDCGLQNELWDGIVALRASDLSQEGLWLDTPFALDPGEELVVSFVPPGESQELWACAQVARVGMWRRDSDPWPVGMGLTFTYVSSTDRRYLARALMGHPPRLPVRRRPPPLPSRRQSFQGQERRRPVALGLADVMFED
jgi:hypothetical protein